MMSYFEWFITVIYFTGNLRATGLCHRSYLKKKSASLRMFVTITIYISVLTCMYFGMHSQLALDYKINSSFWHYA